MTRTLRIGTRGSTLALVQAHWVAARLAELGVATEISIIRTEGDDRPVDTGWGEGAFVGRIVAALLDGTVDLAVHSAKDVPTAEPDRLVIAAYPPREDARDALVARDRGTTLATLPEGARVGTDSPRRAAFLLAARPDLRLHPLHGNVDTRLAKLDRGDSDALVLAAAGLTRLGRADRIDEILASTLVLSAPGQGSLAVQTRVDDAEAIAAVGLLDDPATRAAVETERAFLAGTGGGCRSAVGALGTVTGGVITLLAAAGRAVGADDEIATGGATGVIALRPIAWVRGSAPVAERDALAERLAARIVEARNRPRVLVARPVAHAGELARDLQALGVEPALVPAIETRPVVEGSSLDRALLAAANGDWVVLASANAARGVLAATARTGVEAARLRWAAVGDATAAVLLDAGMHPVFVPTHADGETLGAELPVARGDRVLVPRADIADGRVAAILAERGARVTDVVAYTTVEAPDTSVPLLAGVLDDGPLDALVLSSGSTARGLLRLALALAPDGAVRARVLAVPVIAAGASTASVARELGYATVLVAPSPASADLAAFTATCLGVAANTSGAPEIDPSNSAGETR